jgi:hypothetical protein
MNDNSNINEMDRFDHVGELDGIPVKRCLKSGFCCTKQPCAYGEWNDKKSQCKYLSEPNEIGQKVCTRYEWIKENVPTWEFYPAFGGGCCMPLGNTLRDEILIKLKQKQNGR